VKQGEIQYRAFVSYSHADKRVVDWLHRALESYRIPAKLVGFDTALGPVPARLGSLFRDRDELPAAGDLSVELKAALKRSMFLIVVCSRAAAQSRWVNEEVRQFKLLHGHKRGDGTARVLALIADGDPGDAESGACFPPALKFHVLPDGTISDDPAEPIAADIRPGGDGRKLAKLKLVAGLTGLPLDALVQREEVRRQRRLGLVAGASLVLTAVMAVLTVLAIQGRREAERQRAQADGLIEFMLTDLREKLEPVGRLEVLDSVGQKALAYYQAQDLDALDPDELGRRARALHLVGEVRDLRGDSAAALKAFREAERTTAELLARDPENPDRMFDHAQSAFWVGQTAWARKEWPTAEDRFRRYVELADRMAATDRQNLKWRMEQGYAANSLGALYLDRGRAEDALPQFRTYLAATREVAQREPDNPNRAWEVGQAHAWLSDALEQAGLLAEAERERLSELRAYAEVLAADSGDAQVRLSQSVTQEALAELRLLQGDIDGSAARARAAFQDVTEMLRQDPANLLWQDVQVSTANQLSEGQLLNGQWADAARTNSVAQAGAELLVAGDPKNADWRTGRLMRARWIEIAILFGTGQTAAAQAGLQRFDTEFRRHRSDDLAAGDRMIWTVVDGLATADRLATDDPAAARAYALQAQQAAGPDPQAREAAVLAELQRMGLLAGPPARAVTTSRYPAKRLLALVGDRPG
jgi:hypothetical protein